MKIFELGSGLGVKIILFSCRGHRIGSKAFFSVRVLLCVMTWIAVMTNRNKSGGIS